MTGDVIVTVVTVMTPDTAGTCWDEVKRSLFHLGRQLTVVSSITYKKTNGDET